MIPMTILRLLTSLWRWPNKKELICGFFFTMLGVWAAFWLAGLGERSALDRNTEQRLHLAILESQYNGTLAMEILDEYTKQAVVNIAVKRFNVSAAQAAFDDSNVLSFLPHHKVSLIRSYIEAIATLNQAVEMHQGILERTDYKGTAVEEEIRKNVLLNAASVFAMAFVLQEELKEYFEEDSYADQEIERIEGRVKYVKGKALEGQFSLSDKQ